MSINYDILPQHMRASARSYLEDGIKPGSFLCAVIRNDLAEAFGCADDINRERLHDVVRFFYCEAPSTSWGSGEIMVKWLLSFNERVKHD